MSEYRVDFATVDDLASAMKKLRGRWGSRALDHWVPEAVMIAILLLAAALAVADMITPRDLIAFVLGYYVFSLIHRRYAHRLAAPFLPEEFRHRHSASVILSEDGLSTLTGGSEAKIAWHLIPPPSVFKDGLVFRVAPDLAVPFPTSGVGASPTELAKTVAGWKSRRKVV